MPLSHHRDADRLTSQRPFRPCRQPLSARLLAVGMFVAMVALPPLTIQAQEVPMARPMMISEAKLPVGFPAPGPVGEVIVKTYPAHRLARVRAERNNDNGMFMQLFRHIERQEIAMTAPVEMCGRETSRRPPNRWPFSTVPARSAPPVPTRRIGGYW